MENYNICPICGNKFIRQFSYTGPTCGKDKCVEKYLELQKKNGYSSFNFNRIPEKEMNKVLRNRRLKEK